MKFSIIYLFAIFISIFSCSPTIENKEKPLIQKSADSVKVRKSTITIEEQIIDDNFKPRFEDFAQKTLGDNLRKHDFEYVINNYKLYDLLPIDGLQKIVAFSNKNYPKKSIPIYYQHFLLFAYEYSTKNQAINNFNNFYLTSQLDLNDTIGIDESYLKKAKLIKWTSKPGGLIVQKGNWIFHLVKSCGNTPIGGRWLEYENEFLSFLKDKEDYVITILNANCGGLNYKKEERAF